jgi:hypothetical protein
VAGKTHQGNVYTVIITGSLFGGRRGGASPARGKTWRSHGAVRIRKERNGQGLEKHATLGSRFSENILVELPDDVDRIALEPGIGSDNWPFLFDTLPNEQAVEGVAMVEW